MSKKNNKRSQQHQQQKDDGQISRAEFDALRLRVKQLEDRCEKLEAAKLVSENVSEQLRKEVDRLDQYGRCYNVVIRNIELPKNETNEQVEEKVTKLVEKSL